MMRTVGGGGVRNDSDNRFDLYGHCVELAGMLAGVWFQNRRTKWRKKHAAEMATAKRKQEELGDGDGDCSEPMDSDSESLDLVDTGSNQRKRCRMEDDMRH
uniref:Uncharacterized protein n=1 Tax=Anopheles stephensi TaxID=30069 RepID=A0A182XX06_ANOST